MESPLDIALVIVLSLAALAFVVWRFALTKAPPACAPDEKGKPQVILGSNLAKGLAGAKKSAAKRP